MDFCSTTQECLCHLINKTTCLFMWEAESATLEALSRSKPWSVWPWILDFALTVAIWSLHYLLSMYISSSCIISHMACVIIIFLFGLKSCVTGWVILCQEFDHPFCYWCIERIELWPILIILLLFWSNTIYPTKVDM